MAAAFGPNTSGTNQASMSPPPSPRTQAMHRVENIQGELNVIDQRVNNIESQMNGVQTALGVT